jgi:hypothetical protein
MGLEQEVLILYETDEIFENNVIILIYLFYSIMSILYNSFFSQMKTPLAIGPAFDLINKINFVNYLKGWGIRNVNNGRIKTGIRTGLRTGIGKGIKTGIGIILFYFLRKTPSLAQPDAKHLAHTLDALHPASLPVCNPSQGLQEDWHSQSQPGNKQSLLLWACIRDWRLDLSPLVIGR